jgi:hypothetical protein
VAQDLAGGLPYISIRSHAGLTVGPIRRSRGEGLARRPANYRTATSRRFCALTHRELAKGPLDSIVSFRVPAVDC